MEEQENKKEDKKKDIQKDTLQPITKVNSKLDKNCKNGKLIQLPVVGEEKTTLHQMYNTNLYLLS